MTHQEFRDALFGRIHLPREWGASWLSVNPGMGGTDFIEVQLKNGETWKITMQRTRRGIYEIR